MPALKELLRSFRNLTIFVEMAQTGGGLNSVGNLIDNTLDQPSRCPPDSLGQAYAARLLALHYDADFFRPRPVDTEAQWLTQRIATTHDIHPVVAGFPGYVAINLVASFAAFRFKLDQHETISRSIAHGHAIALEAAPLVVQRWEEHWERPLAEWRQRPNLLHQADDQPSGSGASPAP